MVLLCYKWLMTSLVAFLHPLFMGVTEIQHNAQEHTLEISVKLFADDFENALEKANHTTIDITNPKDTARASQLIARYLKQHLQLKVNGKPVQLVFIGYEKEREAAWSFIQVNDINTVQKVEITNTLLYDAYDQQINLMHVIVNGNRKSTKLSYPDQQVSFEF